MKALKQHRHRGIILTISLQHSRQTCFGRVIVICYLKAQNQVIVWCNCDWMNEISNHKSAYISCPIFEPYRPVVYNPFVCVVMSKAAAAKQLWSTHSSSPMERAGETISTGVQGTLFYVNRSHLSLEINLIQRVLHQASALDLRACGRRII